MKRNRQHTAGKYGKLVLAGTLIFTLAAAAGCGSSSDSGTTEAGSGSETNGSSEAVSAADESSTGETFAAVEMESEVEVADYDPSKYVTLGDYKNLTIDILTSEVSDDDVQSEIDAQLEDNATEEDVTDGAATGDYLNIDYTLTIDGEKSDDFSGTDYDIYLGDESFGSEVDQALTGAKAGDTKSVELTLDGSIYGDEYDGKTGTYDITVNRVYTYKTPELTDDYVKANTDYDSVDAYREGVRKTLEEQNTDYNRTEAGTRALDTVVDSSTFSGYPQDLYDSVYQDYNYLYTSYAENMFGVERSELISDDDLKSEVEQAVNEALVVQAIADNESIEVTDDEYNQYLEDNYESYGYSSVDEFKEQSYETALRREALQSEVENWLLDNNKLNELSQEEYDEKYGSSYDSLSESDSLSGDSFSDGSTLSGDETLSVDDTLSGDDSLSASAALNGETTAETTAAQ